MKKKLGSVAPLCRVHRNQQFLLGYRKHNVIFTGISKPKYTEKYNKV
jgi:hypothetical protein